MREHQSPVRSERLEFVRRADEGQAGHAGDGFGKQLSEAAIGIEAGADRGAALRQSVKLAQAELEPGDAGGDLRRIAGKFLTERERGRILRMRAPDLTIDANALVLRLNAACRCRSVGMSR